MILISFNVSKCQPFNVNDNELSYLQPPDDCTGKSTLVCVDIKLHYEPLVQVFTCVDCGYQSSL